MGYTPKGNRITGEEHNMLAQLQPSTTLTQSLYTPPAGKEAVVTTLAISVYTNDVTLSLFHSETGTTFDLTTSLISNVKIEKEKNIVILDLGFIPVKQGGNIGIQVDNTSSATFTLYGLEIEEQ